MTFLPNLNNLFVQLFRVVSYSLVFLFEVWHTQINTLCKLCGRELKMNLRLCYLGRLSAIFTLCIFFCKKSPTFIQRLRTEARSKRGFVSAAHGYRCCYETVEIVFEAQLCFEES